VEVVEIQQQMDRIAHLDLFHQQQAAAMVVLITQAQIQAAQAAAVAVVATVAQLEQAVKETRAVMRPVLAAQETAAAAVAVVLARSVVMVAGLVRNELVATVETVHLLIHLGD
jgi:hypothetical protein